MPHSHCLVLAFDGAFLLQGWKEALWAKFYIGAPLRQWRNGADVLGGVERFFVPRIEADESFEAEANAYNEAAAWAMPDAGMI